MPARTVSTDRELQSLKPAAKHYDVSVEKARNLIVRVGPENAKGEFRRSFCLVIRFPGSKHPIRHSFGEYKANGKGDLTLEEARDRAAKWRALIREGIDPRPKRQVEPEPEPEKVHTFGAVAEDYIKRHVKDHRRAEDTTREIRRELIPHWGDRPIASITRKDLVELIEDIVDRGSPYTAHIVLGHIKALFNWAIDRGTYDLEVSPADRAKPKALIGAKKPRQRTLSDDELRAFWRAGGRMGYPFGPLYRLLALTGARRAEIGEARWPEIDLDARLWTIPAERFKSDSEHLVPLSDDALAILRDLPRFKRGDHLFTVKFGETPVTGFSNAKVRLDARMLRTLKALARARGEDPASVTLPPWVIHDVRRTVRTRLSSLRVPDRVAEMVIGHGAKGLQRTYDLHHFLPEMREALEEWTARLRSIVQPPPPNVIDLERERERTV